MKRKGWAALLAFLLSVVFVAPLFVTDILAATPTYNMSSQYLESKYYDNFSKVPLTGDQAADVVAIALSQLGYHEGNGNADLGGLNQKGTRDFVEYNVLYGKLDNNQGNGVSYGYYWCASFVNWCLRQAGVSKEASAAAEVSCQRWMTKCEEAGIFVSKDKRVPLTGDLVFFKDAGSGVKSTHMGIVLYSDGSRVYTVEGNTSDGSYSSNGNYVALKSYPLSSSYVVGYGVPAYAKKAGVLPVDYSGEHMSTGLYVSKSAVTGYTDPSMKGTKVTIGAYEVFSVTEVRDECFCVEYEKNGRKTEVWAELYGKACQLTSESVTYTVSYLDESGRDLFPKQFRAKGASVTVPDGKPLKSNAGFLGWSYQKGSTEDLIAPGEALQTTGGDVVLWAVWDYTFYLITFKDVDGSILSQKYGYYGEEFTLPIPENIPEGYVFDGWDVEELQTVITGDAVYTAVYREVAESSFESLDEASEVETNEIPTQEKGCKSAIGIAGLLIPASLCGLAFVRFKKEEK